MPLLAEKVGRDLEANLPATLQDNVNILRQDGFEHIDEHTYLTVTLNIQRTGAEVRSAIEGALAETGVTIKGTHGGPTDDTLNMSWILEDESIATTVPMNATYLHPHLTISVHKDQTLA